jgi:type I restriction enzyme S subunit
MTPETPDGWQVRPVRDFASRTKRINVQGEDLEPLSVTKDRGVVLQSSKYNKRIATDSRKYVVAADGEFAFDPMSLYYGAIGRVQGIGRGLISPDYVVFAADPTVDPTFLNYRLRDPRMHDLYESLSETGNSFGKRRRLYWSIFEEIRLLLPPLSEQKRIAAILSSLDDAIESTQAVIGQLDVVKKAMMAELLTRGTPGRHTRFKMTEIGEVPEEWDVVTAAEVCERIVVGIVIKPASYYVPTGVPALRGKNVRENRLDLDDLVFISTESNSLLRKSQIRSGDVLTVRTGAPGVSCVAPPSLDGANCIDLILSTPRPDRVLGGFLARLMNSPVGVASVLMRKGGLAQQHFNVGAMKETPLPMPPIDEQGEILQVLDALDARSDSEHRVRQALSVLKTALMSVLLTGEVRVNPDEEAA